MRAFESGWYALMFVVAVSTVAANTSGLHELGTFLGSVLLLEQGQNPYGEHALTHRPEAFGPILNLNPPTLFPLFQTLAQLDPSQARIVWLALSGVCWLLTAGLLMHAYRDQVTLATAAFLLALPAVWDTLALGQVYLPLALLSGGAWLWFRNGRDVLAGLAIGILAAVKPQFLVWPGLLLLAGYWRAAGAAGVSGLLTVGVSLALYGAEPWRQWIDVIRAKVPLTGFAFNGSIIGFATRFGVPMVGLIVTVGLLLAAAVWAWRVRPSVERLSGAAIVVALLASPISWLHYSVFAAPILVSRWKDRGIAGVTACLLLAMPLYVVFVMGKEDALIARLTIGSIYSWAYLALALVTWRAPMSSSHPRTANTIIAPLGRLT